MRTSLHEGFAKRDTTEIEAYRFKVCFSCSSFESQFVYIYFYYKVGTSVAYLVMQFWCLCCLTFWSGNPIFQVGKGVEKGEEENSYCYFIYGTLKI